MTNTEVLERVIARLPMPQQITNITFSSDTAGVRFDWRGTRYSVSQHLSVEEVRDNMCHGTDAAMLMSALLKTVPR